jgi:tetratricopeptide (TPR) repeat protein
MKKQNLAIFALLLPIIAFLLLGAVFASIKEEKIPITTKSEKALKYYLQGRDLYDRLLKQESAQFFEKAVAEDPNFALAYLHLALVQPSGKGFFEMLDKAKALFDKISEGERLYILGFEAGANRLYMKQGELCKKLVELYPKDEVAHFLLGHSYMVQQEFLQAIKEYEKAIEIAPNFSLAYNLLGYTHRALENYTEAEKAFKKYIELLPDNPTPYDSYAALLMKMGRYDASIEQYQKALSINANFVTSHAGIAANLNFKGNHEEARKQLRKLYDIARNDGERRFALYAMTVSYVDEGKIDEALEIQKKRYAIAEKNMDTTLMSADLILMGDILLETGRFDEALAKYKKAVKFVEESDLSQEAKDYSKRIYLFNSARAALKKNDFAVAKAKSDEFRKKVEEINNAAQILLSHELAGMIALEEKDYDKALEEFQQANLQNPHNLYRIALTYKGKGNKEKAKEFSIKAAKFNALNSINQAFIRKKAQQLLDSI